MNNSKNILIAVLIAIVVGAGGFFAGMKYQQSRRFQFTGRQFGNTPGGMTGGQGQRNSGNNQGGGFRPVTGQISSVGDNSITVTMSDGSSRIVILSDSTTYSQTTQGTKSDLAVGTQVGVFGTTNADGSVTAQNVQINPAFRNLNNAQPTGGGSK